LKCDGTRAETRFRLSAKRTSPFKSAVASVQSTTGSRGVRISGSNGGYTMFRGSVKVTGYPLYSPISPSLPRPVRHRVPSHFNWTLPTDSTSMATNHSLIDNVFKKNSSTPQIPPILCYLSTKQHGVIPEDHVFNITALTFWTRNYFFSCSTFCI